MAETYVTKARVLFQETVRLQFQTYLLPATAVWPGTLGLAPREAEVGQALGHTQQSQGEEEA